MNTLSSICFFFFKMDPKIVLQKLFKITFYSKNKPFSFLPPYFIVVLYNLSKLV
jgi:hypothetical protein